MSPTCRRTLETRRHKKQKARAIAPGLSWVSLVATLLILSSYGRAYPRQAMDDRQQRQAARPQRMRDIRTPL